MSSRNTRLPALQLIREGLDRSTWQCVAATMFLVALTGASAAVAPLALKQLVDIVSASTQGTEQGDQGAIIGHVALYVVMLFCSRLAADFRPLLASRVEQRVLAALRLRFLVHVLRLPMSYVIKRRGGELQHSVDLAAAGSQHIISHLANSLVPVCIELTVMIATLAQLREPALFAIFAVTAIAYLFTYGAGAIRLKAPAKAVSAASLEVHAQLADGVANAELLRCFGAGPQATASLRDASSRLASRWEAFNRVTVSVAIAASIILAGALTACLALASEAAVLGRMTVGGFVLVSVYLLQMVRPLEVLGSAARDLSRALSFMQPLIDILDQAPEATPPPAAVPLTARAGRSVAAPSLRLENLQFGYDPNRPVIRGLDLDIAPGRVTAVVGPSGSGKSSLVRLLLRLYSPQAGRILVNGLPIEAMPIQDLRSLFGLVPQEAGLLHATAAENIALGMPGSTAADVVVAARAAQIHHVLEALPRGYDTLLGERGQTLSGGERQRLAIARALLRKPSIFVFDEPTSMLDSGTEADIMSALRQITAGCTTIVIAHRLSTVMDADEIVVLDQGRVQERGRHADLLASKGLYAHLWRQQTEGATGGA